MVQICIDMRSYRWIGYACFLFSLPGIILPLASLQYGPAIEFVIFAALSLYIALCSGMYTINAKGLCYESRLGRWCIPWSEVTAAEFSRMGSLLLIGGDKRFVLAPPTWWPRSGREQARQFVSEQLKHHNIVSTLSYTADYKWMKNTRVRNSGESK